MDERVIELDANFRLDKNIPIPLYYQLKQYIINQVEIGNWPPAARIPSELRICESLGISRPTVRQAITELVSEGYLYRRNRVVTVARPKLDGEFFAKLQSFNEEIREKGLTPSTRVLTVEVVRNKQAAKSFGMHEDTSFVRLERLRYANMEPYVYLETFLPYDRFPELKDVDFESASLYDTLEEMFGVRVVRAERTFEAVKGNEKEAKWLEISRNAPICFVKTIAFAQDGTPVEFSVARYRGDKSKFHIVLGR